MTHLSNSSPLGYLSESARIVDMTFTALVTCRALYAAAKLGIPDQFQEQERSSDEIAQATGTHPVALYRLLRTLSSAGIVTELPDDRFALTPLGRWLRSDEPGSLRDWVIFTGETFYLQAWQEILYSVRTGKPAWDEVHGMTVFEYLRQHSEAALIFDKAMTSLSHERAQAVASAFDFSRFHTVVDVGGGAGGLLTTILKAFSKLRGILFDQPQVVEEARGILSREGLALRCEIVGGDFFQTVPQGGDVYVLKSVIHDWDDEHSLMILKNCRRAMTKDARLLLVETVVPSTGEPHYAKYNDLETLVLLGSQERSLEEYAALLEKAEFNLVGAHPTHGPLTIVEAVPV